MWILSSSLPTSKYINVNIHVILLSFMCILSFLLKGLGVHVCLKKSSFHTLFSFDLISLLLHYQRRFTDVFTFNSNNREVLLAMQGNNLHR